jgi:hypothetical protein
VAEIIPAAGVDDPGVPGRESGLQLYQNQPNPFNPMTRIEFETSLAGPARVTIRTVRGDLVWSQRWDRLLAGAHIVQWRGVDSRGRSLPTGVYVYTLESQTERLSRKMLLVR